MIVSGEQFAIISGVGLFAGILSAMTGGSGMIILPTLLMAGLPPHFALGTNKLYTTSTLFTSALTFMRRGLFNPKIWMMIVFATLIGAGVGALLVQVFHPAVLTKVLPVFILGISVYFIFNRFINDKIKRFQLRDNSENSQLKLVFGSLLGVYSGFFGAGTGSICTALGISLLKMDMHEASAMSRFLCCIANIVALVTFILMNRVDYHIGASLIVLGSIGAYVGARLSLKLAGETLRKMIILSSGMMGMILLVKAWV